MDLEHISKWISDNCVKMLQYEDLKSQQQQKTNEFDLLDSEI